MTYLLFSVAALLKTIEDIGRQDYNLFSNIESVSQQGEVNPDHPVFGLKRDLIRLLGNMAYRHRANQDMVSFRVFSLLFFLFTFFCSNNLGAGVGY